jgi:hypothetical protein
MKPKHDVIKVSPLGKTWVIDIDGTVVKHNGYKIDGRDSLLAGASSFFENIGSEDMVILVTSRGEELKKETEDFLTEHGIRRNHIIYNAPMGERILINDRKPSGLNTAIAINTRRDEFCTTEFQIDGTL